MKKAIEFNINENELKRYLEESLIEEKIDYKIRIEDRWIQHYEQASEYYQVYCIYVDSNHLDNVRKLIEDFENATIVTDGIEELQNVEEQTDEKYKKFTKKNFLKYYWSAIIIIGILIVIGVNFLS